METLPLLAENLRNARRKSRVDIVFVSSRWTALVTAQDSPNWRFSSFSSVGSVVGGSSTGSIAGGSTVGSKAKPSVDEGSVEDVGSRCLRFLRNIGGL
ncbi:hypothetical protein OUZ56_033641 [Daphnia magna]|uniref:Uncharacterized protein n=1 Tax=Daphnia magna TaxID=35525 RepID=A0ABR0BAY2_9CRUS|nr:hypothetical protein OUZ56_033641 [Daphnia magna]